MWGAEGSVAFAAPESILVTPKILLEDEHIWWNVLTSSCLLASSALPGNCAV